MPAWRKGYLTGLDKVDKLKVGMTVTLDSVRANKRRGPEWAKRLGRLRQQSTRPGLSGHPLVIVVATYCTTTDDNSRGLRSTCTTKATCWVWLKVHLTSKSFEDASQAGLGHLSYDANSLCQSLSNISYCTLDPDSRSCNYCSLG